MTETRSPRGLVEASLLVSLTVVLYLVSTYVPLAGIAARFLVPVPIIITVMRRGLRVGIMASVVSAFLIAFMTSPFEAVVVLFSVGLVGLVMGGMIREGESPARVVLAGTIATAVGVGVVYLVSALVLGNNPITMLSKELSASLDTAVGIYKKAGLSANQIKETKRMFKEMLKVVGLTVPSGVLAFSMVSTAIHYWVTANVVRRIGTPIAPLPGIRTLAFPKGVTVALLGGLAVYMAGVGLRYQPLVFVGINAVCFLALLLLVQGIGVVGCLARQQWATMKWFMIFLFLWNPFLFLYLLAILGGVDTFRDFRRLRVRKDGEVE